jgi:hypothetical protein
VRSVVVGVLLLYNIGGNFKILFGFVVKGGLLPRYTSPPSWNPLTLLRAWCVGQHTTYS